MGKLTNEEIKFIHKWRRKYADELGTNYKINFANGKVYINYGNITCIISYCTLKQLMAESED